MYAVALRVSRRPPTCPAPRSRAVVSSCRPSPRPSAPWWCGPAPFALGCLALLLATGCRSSTPADPSKPHIQVLRPGQNWHPRTLDLTEADERQIEAHARFAAGLVDELNEDSESALAHYLVAIENDPTNDDLTVDVARKLVELHRVDEARQLLERSVARKDASGLVWGWLGLVHKVQGRAEAAQAAQREAIRRLPSSILGYQNLAQIYLEGGQLAAAVGILEEAARQPDTDTRFLIVLADILGTVQQLKDPAIGNLKPRILALLDRAAAMKPEKPPEVLQLADLYQVYGEGAKALPLYQGLLESDPDLPGLRERLAEVYLRTADREKAAEQLRIVVTRQPTNPLLHYYLGVLALEGRRFDEAVSEFNQVLILRPDNEAIYYDLAIAHLSHNRPEEALAVLDRARAKFRLSFQVEFYTAAALSELKRYEDAIKHYTAAEVVAAATAPDQLTALFYFQSGVAYERLKRYDDAAVQFEKAVELKPDFADALNYLGYMWAERGTNLPRARELIQKAVELEPENGAFLDSLAWVLHQLDRSAEALPLQLKAMELTKEPDATLHEHLGDILLKLGRKEEARKAWQRAQELEPKPEVAEKIRQLGS